MIGEDLLRYKNNIKYVYFDMETWNLCLNFCFNRPFEIECLESIGKNTINSTNLLINWLNEKPDLFIENDVALINHYNKDKVLKEGLDPKAAFNIFWPKLQNAEFIIIHNGLNFDCHLLKEYALYMNADWKFLLPKIIDTNALAKGIKLGIKFDKDKESFLNYQFRIASIVQKGLKTNLKLLCKEYDINIEDESLLYSASYDTSINKLLWEKMIWQIEY